MCEKIIFFICSLILSELVPDSASVDISFLQLLVCFCVSVFQESLFLIFFIVLPGSLVVFVGTVAVAYT